MNTPLNEALKPCPFCQSKNAIMEEVAYYGSNRSAERCEPAGHKYHVSCSDCYTEGPVVLDDKDKAIAAWNTRANTQESSNSPTSNGAAQGAIDPLLRAMMDEGIIAQPSDATAQPINTDDMNDIVLRGLASLNEQEAGDLLAEMDDVAPRVDLTDERAAFERYMLDECLRDLQELTQHENGDYDDVDVHSLWTAWLYRAVLANTAQDKPEQCPTCRGNDADAPCAYPSCGMTGCLRDKRLAAKKG